MRNLYNAYYAYIKLLMQAKQECYSALSCIREESAANIELKYKLARGLM